MQRRRAIAEAALAVFCERGYTATTMDEISARAGCSKGGLYHHFQGRERILEAVASMLANEGAFRTPADAAARLGVGEAPLARLVVEILAECARDEGVRAQIAIGDAEQDALIALGKLIQAATQEPAAEEARRAA